MSLIARMYIPALLAAVFMLSCARNADAQEPADLLARIQELIQTLQSEDSLERERARDELVKIGTPALDALTRALYSPYWYVRESATGAIGKIGGPGTAEDLARMLKDESVHVRVWAAFGLVTVGNRVVVKPLVKAMGDSSPVVRGWAAKALLKIGDPSAAKAFIRALKDSDKIVRLSAAMALEKIGDKKAVNNLIGCLKDPEEKVRSWSVRALGKIGSRKAARPLLPLMKDSSAEVRACTAQALGKLKDRAAVVALVQGLKDTDAKVRMWCIWSLGEIGGPNTAVPIAPFLKDPDPAIRRLAVSSLGLTRNPKAAGFLVQALKDADKSVQIKAGKALVDLKDLSTDTLIRFLKDPDDSLRIWSAFLLGKIGASSAAPQLAKAIFDKNRAVRLNAENALIKIGRPAVPDLIRVLASKEKRQRYFAAKTLGSIGDKEAVAPLIQCFGDEDARFRSIAEQALVKIGAPSVEALLQALGSTVKTIRFHSAFALGALRKKQSVDTLIEALKSPSRDFNIRAAATLGFVPHAKAVDPLLKALKSSDSYLRKYAAIALGCICDMKAIDPLQKLWKKELQPRVKIWAAGALVRTAGDKEAFDFIVGSLQTNSMINRIEAARALAYTKDKRSIGPLISALLSDNERFRKVVCRALQSLTKQTFDSFEQWRHWYDTEWKPKHGEGK